MEPAQLDCAVLLGPHTHIFRAVVGQLRAANACLEVADPSGLAPAVGRLLADPAARRALADAASAVARANHGILDTVMDELAPFLDRLSPAAPPGSRGRERGRAYA